jgi:hypothetical protein
MRCRLARLGLLRRRQGKLDAEDHGGVLMAEFRRRTQAQGVHEQSSLARAHRYACTGPEVLPEMRDAHREQLEKLARQQRNASRDRHESRELAVA